MAPKPPALTTHHCPGRKEGHGACKDTEKPYNGKTASWCQHYIFCAKHPKQAVYLHNVRSKCRECGQEEKVAEVDRRKKADEERAQINASKPSKEDTAHQERNDRNLQKEISKLTRIHEREALTIKDTLDEAKTEEMQREVCVANKRPKKFWRRWLNTEPVARPLRAA